MSDTQPPSQTPSEPEEPGTGIQPVHKHDIKPADRAEVVGKCLKPATGANKVIEVLVDIAG